MAAKFDVLLQALGDCRIIQSGSEGGALESDLRRPVCQHLSQSVHLPDAGHSGHLLLSFVQQGVHALADRLTTDQTGGLYRPCRQAGRGVTAAAPGRMRVTRRILRTMSVHHPQTVGVSLPQLLNQLVCRPTSGALIVAEDHQNAAGGPLARPFSGSGRSTGVCR